jgi:hypothetical protein
MWSKAWNWVRRSWWGLVVAYLSLVLGSYLAIWQFIVPLGIPDTFARAPGVAGKRVFYHIVLALLVASHGTLLLELWRRRATWSDVARGSAEPASQNRRDEKAGSECKAQLDQALDRLKAARAKLNDYESLEQEIIGLLAGGLEVEVEQIAGRLQIGGDRDAAKNVRVAVASLRAAGKVIGTGGVTPKVKLTPTSPGSTPVSEDHLNVLKRLAEAGEELEADEVAGLLSMNFHKAHYYIDELVDRKHVYVSSAVGRPARYGIAKQGRALLAEHGLL